MGEGALMAGPWERYQAAHAPQSGPWLKYTERPVAPTTEQAPDPTGSFGENLLAGAGKAFSDIGLGLEQINASTGVPQQGQVAPSWGETQQNMAAEQQRLSLEAAERTRLDKPLMRTGGGITGNIAGNIAATLPAAGIPGAATYGGAAATGGALGLVQPTRDRESRILNTGLGVGAGVAGKYVGDKIIGAVQAKRAAGAVEKAASQSKDATLAASREAGYVVPPTQANPKSAWNQILEGFSGKIKTGQAASVRNQTVTNKLAKEAVGLADDAPLTKEGLKAIRATAGEEYANVASFGRYAADSTFKKQITALSSAQRTLAKEIPELGHKDVLDIAKSLDRSDFDGNTVVELTKALRERAGQAFKEGATDAGRFYRGASDALEDLIERNMMSANKGGLEAFRAARQMIAKTYTIEAALNESTGNVVGAKLAAQLTKGKPLSGGLKTAAGFAQAFPKAAQDVEKSGAALATSPLDWGAMGTISALTGNPYVMAGVAARPAARSLILSQPYQSLMTQPGYGPGMTVRAISDLLAKEPVRAALPGAAAIGSIYAK
jgi:hypothetical protein